MFIANSFAVTVPIKSIEIKSEKLNFDTNEAGSWKVTKSASWISKNKARITFDIDSIEKINNEVNDVIFVIDTSESMSEANISSISDAVKNVLDKLKGKAALISFNDTANVLSDFTDDFDSIYNLVNSLVLNGNTNYYQALVKVDELLNSYVYDGKRSVSLVFLTDGYPSSDTPNEVSQFEYLKNKYNYLDVRAIQYNIGSVIVDNIKNISDRQFWANDKNINEVLYKAVFDIVYYDYFKIVDNVNEDYFSIDSVNSDVGEVSINNNQVIWNINDFISGSNSKLAIDVTLKEFYQDGYYLFETNTSEVISSKIGDLEENITSTLTPILSNNYTVTYDANALSGCSVTNVPVSKQYFVFDTVTIADEVPVCFGYQFKEWKIDNKVLEKVNDDNFIMPEENVVLKAVWSKLGLNKSMDGSISELATLYKVLEKEATSGGLAKEYTGEHQDSIAGTGTKKIYHYYAKNDTEGTAILDKNNVIFADMCWQMIRTTDTGGVKMIYNGEPDSNGACGTDRGTHVGYNGRSNTYLANNYYYGTDYIYDNENKTFKLMGDLTLSTWSSSTYNDLIGKYTCLLTNSTDTCTTLYYVESFADNYKAKTFKITGDSHYSQFGVMPFNVNSNSMSYVGYMYNTSYNWYREQAQSTYVLKSLPISSSFYFSDSYTYNSRNNRYTLNNAYTLSNLSEAKGLYTFRAASSGYSNGKVFYIVDVIDTTMYYIELLDGNDLDFFNYTYSYGDSYTDNGDGTYTINNPSDIKRIFWLDNYNAPAGKYMCVNPVNNVCDEMLYVKSTSNVSFSYINVSNNYKYAEKFVYENGVYKLTGEMVSFWDISNASNVEKISNAHYSCFNTSGECETINYLYNYSYDSFYYIKLSDGKNIDDAINEMLYNDDVNVNDSNMKKSIDLWYKKYLYEYTVYLEDTVYCNDRSIKNLGGWNSNGGTITDLLLFEGFYSKTDSLLCVNEMDRFSLANNNAKLKYPVGLITVHEMKLLGNSKVRYTGNGYWLSDACYINNYSTTVGCSIYSRDGTIGVDGVTLLQGVRPAISLKKGTTYVSGDGSMNSPYIVDMDS